MTKYSIILLFLLCVGTANATEIKFSLLEERTSEIRYYVFDTNSDKLKKSTKLSGKTIYSKGPFEIKKYKLFLGEIELAEASEILFQGKTDDSWFLIIRDEYNSMSNPFRWLASFLGHPIQVSKIQLLVVRNQKLITNKKIRKEPSSYHWYVKVFE
jgi:hypothetical protein